MFQILILTLSFESLAQINTSDINVKETGDKVGIGVDQPTHTLDVNGSLRVRSLNEGVLKSNADGNITSAKDNNLKVIYEYLNSDYNISDSPSGLRVTRSAGSAGGHTHYGVFMISFLYRELEEIWILSLQKQYNSNFIVSCRRLSGMTSAIDVVLVNNPVSDDNFILEFQPPTSVSDDWHHIRVVELIPGKSSSPSFSRIGRSQFNSGNVIASNSTELDYLNNNIKYQDSLCQLQKLPYRSAISYSERYIKSQGNFVQNFQVKDVNIGIN